MEETISFILQNGPQHQFNFTGHYRPLKYLEFMFLAKVQNGLAYSIKEMCSGMCMYVGIHIAVHIPLQYILM